MVDVSTPEALVTAFIADYQRWNDEASSSNDRGDGGASMERAKAAYWQMLEPYVADGTPILPIAFGSESDHAPNAEVIQNIEINGDKAIVSTLFTNPKFDFLKNRYEYDLVNSDNRWWLTGVFLVDDDGRYPGL